MSSPIPTELISAMPAGRSVNPAIESLPGFRVTADSGTLFKNILADEGMLSDVMDELKDILPKEIFDQIEGMVESGNDLPLAAIFSPELFLSGQELSKLPQMIQDAMKSDGGVALPDVVAALKLSEEDMQEPGAAVAGRTLGNIGRQISEALTAAMDDGDAAATTSIGKQIQELLSASKAESTVSAAVKAETVMSEVGSIPKVLLSHSAGDSATTINSAISGLTQLSSFQASAGSSMPPAISAPVGNDAAWGQAMGDRIMWMMGKGVQSASIRINPPELGPIHVQLSVNGDQASVSMLVHNGVVKDALDAAIPRLREMLGESNLNLVNVDVSHRENPNQGSGSAMYEQDQKGQLGYFSQGQGEITTLEGELPGHYHSTSLLDDYA